MLQGDPDFGRYEQRERFPWLRFSRSNQSRDSFLELKRSLVKAAETFRGPVIFIHGTDANEPNGFHIDQPLRNDKGLTVSNLTRVAIAFRNPQMQWLEVQTDARWRPPFRLRVREVRKRDATSDTTQPETPLPTSTPPAMPRNDLLEYCRHRQRYRARIRASAYSILMPPTLPPLLPESKQSKAQPKLRFALF